MRIVIASTYVPFLKGGGTKIIEDLAAALTTAGHQVETVMIPMSSHWPSVPEQTLAIRLLDLTEACGNRIDRLIAVRYPSYACPTRKKSSGFSTTTGARTTCGAPPGRICRILPRAAQHGR